jgi:hypothetical protein
MDSAPTVASTHPPAPLGDGLTTGADAEGTAGADDAAAEGDGAVATGRGGPSFVAAHTTITTATIAATAATPHHH